MRRCSRSHMHLDLWVGWWSRIHQCFSNRRIQGSCYPVFRQQLWSCDTRTELDRVLEWKLDLLFCQTQTLCDLQSSRVRSQVMRDFVPCLGPNSAFHNPCGLLRACKHQLSIQGSDCWWSWLLCRSRRWLDALCEHWNELLMFYLSQHSAFGSQSSFEFRLHPFWQ